MNKVSNTLCEVVCSDVADLILSYAWPKEYTGRTFGGLYICIVRQMCYWGDWESVMKYLKNSPHPCMLDYAATDACFSGYIDLTDKLISIIPSKYTLKRIFYDACRYNKKSMAEYVLTRGNLDLIECLITARTHNCTAIVSLLEDYGAYFIGPILIRQCDTIKRIHWIFKN